MDSSLLQTAAYIMILVNSVPLLSEWLTIGEAKSGILVVGSCGLSSAEAKDMNTGVAYILITHDRATIDDYTISDVNAF